MPEQVRSATLMTARGPFAVLEAQPTRGVTHRRPAVLIPGYTGSKEDFLPILEPLAAAGRTVVAIDQRGQYQSPAAGDRAGYSPEALAADVLAVAEAVGGDGGIHLAGHSLGGLVAREAVLQQAAGFLSLTLLGSGPGAIVGERSDALKQALALLDPTDGAQPDNRTHLSAAVRQAWHDRDEPEARAQGTNEHVLAFLKERRLRTCPVQLIVLARYLLTCPDRTDELADVVSAGLPALVVYGENDDAWLPAEQDQMARRLRAERTCIPGAAHSPAIDAPVTTAATLTNFWNGAERRQPTVHSCGRSGRARSANDARPTDATLPAVARAAGPAPA
jgi:pimeloyl-ACP methyl ester carboxylesterase